MNKQQFWLSDYYIDLSRNQITYQNNTTNLQPKAMAVLKVLVAKQGQVVSFESLMAEVWPDTVVTINTLQRCISQLRKVFNDSPKEVIRTHAKSGYSLEIKISDKNVSRGVDVTRYVGVCLSVVVLACFIAFGLFNLDEEAQQSFSQISAVTNTDDNESDPSYSPNGRYIAYLKNINACESEIWLKDTTTFESRQLTPKVGVYSKPNWSPNGKQLVFSKRNLCVLEKQQLPKAYCWSIKRLHLDTVLDSKTQTEILLDCAQDYVRQVSWLNDKEIVVLKEREGDMGLYRFTVGATYPELLYTSGDKEVYSFTYNQFTQQFSLLAISQNEQHFLIHLNKTGSAIASYALQLPEGTHTYSAFRIHSHPKGDYFITNTNQGIYKISDSGEFSPLVLSPRYRLLSPSFHPNGQSIIATEVSADTDIAYIPFVKMTTEKQLEVFEFTLVRSNASDDMARFQPLGDSMLWSSKRDGFRRVWLSTIQNRQQNKQQNKQYDSKSQLLAAQDDAMNSKSSVWSPTGQRIARIANNNIELVSLSGQKKVIDMPFLVSELYQWTSTNKLLIKGRRDGQEILYSFDINSEQYHPLLIKSVSWAHLIDDKHFVYLSDTLTFYYVQNGEEKHIQQLDGQLERPYFALFRDQIYGINSRRELWRYSLIANQQQTLAQLSQPARYVSDVNERGVLITVMKEFNKELVQLH